MTSIFERPIRTMFASMLAASMFLAPTADAASPRGKSAYIDAEHIDLVPFLTPVPAPNSAAAKEDLAIVLREQSAHTPEQLAKMHAAFSFDRFATTLGWGWNVAELSETRSLIERFRIDVSIATDAAKRRIHRARPFAVSSDVQVIGRTKPVSGSTPSGHATAAYTVAIVLAAALPERAEEIFACADRIAWERVIAGTHFPFDTTSAGRISASVLTYAAFEQPAFKADFEKARAELRSALKLPLVAMDEKATALAVQP